ncbi:MAG: hypothetical protein IPJ19_07560 [Planctomycetes bacterium]|nr:hypothetical protein [Planctomycetota bacterium]
MRLVVTALALLLGAACAESRTRSALAPPPPRDPAFAQGNLCARCHSVSPRASALYNRLGDDVSPHGLWRGTLMANSLRDPYFRAQFAREVELQPADEAQLGQLCLRCHTPMAHHQARLDGVALAPIAQLDADPLARDGVSCTVCHQAQPENLGQPASFSGQLEIRPEHTIFGPYPDPFAGPMRMQTGYTPTQGAHIQASALCGACHTLSTHHAPGAEAFLEQSPYLEWRNSVFSDEAGGGSESRTCQQCHMPDEGTLRIARNPGGRDFSIAPRTHVRAHAFLGGNAYVLDLLRTNRVELGVEAPVETLERAAAGTRRQLAQDTARVTIENTRREDGELRFDVHVENLTGHKFPAGYPSRRAWLEVEVRGGGHTLFLSGAADEHGRLRGVADERALPHRDTVEDASGVVVYEMRALDAQGARTTQLSRMASVAKDTRLLPRGWRADGPHAAETAPVGIEGDADFVGGGDVVHYRLKLPAGMEGRLGLFADLRYQTIPPAWVDDLRALDAQAARTFVRLYDTHPPEPESVGSAVFSLE